MNEESNQKNDLVLGGFNRIDGKLYWVTEDGELIGPLDPSTPTCGENTDGEGIGW